MLARLRLLCGIALLLALVSIEAVWAHAQLLGTDPAESAVLAMPPEAISLIFNEPVSPLAIKLVYPDGTQVDLLDQTTGSATLTVQLPDTPGGTHVLSWRVVSTDGHPIAGSLVYSIGQITGAAPLTATSDCFVSVALWAGRFLLFVSLFVGIGGCAFIAVAALPARSRQTSAILSAVGLLIAPLLLGLQGLDALGLSIASLLNGRVWSAGLSTSYGTTVIVVSVAFASSICALVLPAGGTASIIGFAAATLGALSLALSGHASAADPQWVTRPALFLHVGGILFWVGALLPLWVLLRERTEASDHALARFSHGIPFAVAPLVLSGLTLAFIQMGAPGPQWISPYGTILALKLCLLMMLFALALWNRRWLTAPALAGDITARYRLRRSIGMEAIIVLAILGLVAGWRFTPPPRALADAAAAIIAAEPITVHLMDASTMAMATVSPGSAGPVNLNIELTDMEGNLVDAQDLGIVISSPALGIEPFRRDAVQTETGWMVEGLTIPVAGVWVLDLEIRLSRFQLTKMQTEIEIP